MARQTADAIRAAIEGQSDDNVSVIWRGHC
jgi:hypothetical protein